MPASQARIAGVRVAPQIVNQQTAEVARAYNQNLISRHAASQCNAANPLFCPVHRR